MQAQACIGCASCAQACDIMRAVSPRLPQAFLSQLAEDVADERLRWFVTRCSLCGLCVRACPEGVRLPDAVIAARSLALKRGQLDSLAYRAMWVDCEWNAISLYRRSFGLDFAPFERDRCEAVYLPGCSMLNEAPELTAPALSWLEAHFDCEVGLVSDCCGMPLLEMGLLDRYRAYEDRLWDEICATGAHELVLACPNCFDKLFQRGLERGVRVRTIYELMAQAGYRARGGLGGVGVVSVHDSCPARGTQVKSWVRSILADYELREMRHCGDESMCCGSGGAVAMIDFPLREIRADRRRGEFAETGADVCVCACMSSCATLHAPEVGCNARHVLEFAFGCLVDHDEYRRRSAAMWEGSLGQENARLLEAPC